MTVARTLEERFWSRVAPQPSGCWEWTGFRDEGGYGRCAMNGRQRGAHRVSWTVHYGAIPDGLFVLHRCDNPPCVRPSHLFLGTAQDNSQDASAKGRLSGRRRRPPMTIEDYGRGLSGEVLHQRREERGVSQRQLALVMGTSSSTVALNEKVVRTTHYTTRRYLRALDVIQAFGGEPA